MKPFISESKFGEELVKKQLGTIPLLLSDFI